MKKCELEKFKEKVTKYTQMKKYELEKIKRLKNILKNITYISNI